MLGAQHQVDNQLLEQGLEPIFIGGYRVTTPEAMQAAMEAAGTARTEVESQLSKVSLMLHQHSIHIINHQSSFTWLSYSDLHGS